MVKGAYWGEPERLRTGGGGAPSAREHIPGDAGENGAAAANRGSRVRIAVRSFPEGFAFPDVAAEVKICLTT